MGRSQKPWPVSPREVRPALKETDLKQEMVCLVDCMQTMKEETRAVGALFRTEKQPMQSAVGSLALSRHHKVFFATEQIMLENKK